MSIHHEHPFQLAAAERDPLRRFRGRMPQPVTLWCSTYEGQRAGWTVSSLIVADGAPAELVGLVDPDSDLAGLIAHSQKVAVSLLGWQHRALGDAFAGLAPAPGGVFRLGSWTDTDWGPVLSDALGWIGAEVTDLSTNLGWGLLVRARCARVELGDLPSEGVLTHVRGRYRPVSLD